jgi:hypothetical protein
MSKRNYGLVIAGQSGGIDNDTATKNFDSREFTFKYLDRSKYGGGILSIPQTYASYNYPYPTYVIPHNLGYAPSYRFYVYSRDANNDYAQNNHQYELQQVNGSASVVNAGAYMGRNSFYIYLSDAFGAIADSQIYFVFLIGADNLEADADETRYIS